MNSYFFQYTPLTYSIKRIFCIHNSPQTEQFEASLLMMEGEAQNPVFSPKWQTEDPTGCRAKVMTRWKESAAFSPVAVVRNGTCKRKEVLSRVFVFPYWHGSNQQKVQSICDTGFTYFGKHSYLQGDRPGSTDIGFFGSSLFQRWRFGHAWLPSSWWTAGIGTARAKCAASCSLRHMFAHRRLATVHRRRDIAVGDLFDDRVHQNGPRLVL